jgi:hypothetical protein
MEIDDSVLDERLSQPPAPEASHCGASPRGSLQRGPEGLGTASRAEALNPRPAISGLPRVEQALRVLQWQLRRRGMPSRHIRPLPKVADFWQTNLLDENFTVEVRFVDENTGHGVYMNTLDGTPITMKMAKRLVKLLLREAQMPPPCPDPECSRLRWYWHRNFAVYIGTSIDSRYFCHGLRSTMFRYLNGPDRSALRRVMDTWPYMVFDLDGKVKHLPRGDVLEVRLDYSHDTTQSPEKFVFRTHDPNQQLSIIPFCTTEPLLPEATIQHMLLGPDATDAAGAAAAAAGKRSSREPREWGGLQRLLRGEFMGRSWFTASVARDHEKAGDDAGKKWWDYQIAPGRVKDILGPEAVQVLAAAYTLLKTRLRVRGLRDIWRHPDATTHHLLVSYPGAPPQARHQDGCLATIMIPLQQPPNSGGTMFTCKMDPAATFCFNDNLQLGCAVYFDGAVEHFGAANNSDQNRLLYYIEVGDKNN